MFDSKSSSNLISSSFNSALNRYLYSAVAGLPDTVDLNDQSKKVLADTYGMLNEQIERDATPEFLEELKSKICAGDADVPHSRIASLTKIFQDKTLNPLNFPFEYLLNGTLPPEPLSKADIEGGPPAVIVKSLSPVVVVKASKK